MEELSEQLRAEISALQEYIARMEDRFLATAWTSEVLAPLKRLESRLDQAELQSIVLLLQRVRDQFSINGQLTPQISALLERYPQYLAGKALSPALLQDPALDPAPLGSPAEDEERAEPAVPAAAGSKPPRVKAPARPPKPQPSPLENEESEDLSGLSMDLFSGRRKAAAAPPPKAPVADQREKKPAPSTLNLFPLGETGQGPVAERASISPRQDLFLAHKIRPADLKTHLQLTLPSQDQVQLDFKLQKKMSGRLADALREHAERHSLLLIPRITQFAHQGTLYPCTVRVLAKLFRPLLGDLHDLSAYQTCGFMDDTPEPGWALVTPEAMPATLGLNYFDQQQVLRQRADELGVIPRMVRRRTLVEAIYDLIVTQLVLGLKMNRKTLDATSSGLTVNDFICIYSSAEGVRLKHLPRTTSHSSMGVCPSL